jgi:hypothetical protein
VNDRMITTDMSAKIVAGLVKKGWTVRRLARAIDPPEQFIEGVQAKHNVLTMKDVEVLAQRAGENVNLMLLNSMTPRPELRPLFDSVRNLLELNNTPDVHARRKPASRKRRSRKTAA